jgi:hypothetical protein
LRFPQMSSNFCELLFLHPGLSPCMIFHHTTVGYAMDPHSEAWSVLYQLMQGL